MPRKVKLRELCHSRSGDKGHDVNVGIAVYDARHYEWLKRTVTPEVIAEYVSEYLGNEGRGPVTRYELPKLGAVTLSSQADCWVASHDRYNWTGTARVSARSCWIWN